MAVVNIQVEVHPDGASGDNDNTVLARTSMELRSFHDGHHLISNGTASKLQSFTDTIARQQPSSSLAVIP